MALRPWLWPGLPLSQYESPPAHGVCKFWRLPIEAGGWRRRGELPPMAQMGRWLSGLLRRNRRSPKGR